jgi:hypothetical protein
MKYVLLVLMVFSVSTIFCQVPMFGPKESEGDTLKAMITLTETDTLFISPPRYWKPFYQVFTGSATLAGYSRIVTGTDTIATFYGRLIMHRAGCITKKAIYDSSDWHQIVAQSGDYIPAENAVDSAGIGFSIDLADQPWWKPSLGIQIKIGIGSGAAIIKEMELYLITTKESN